jgi:predicted HD superfamily hydrolase involved in NAD metabolism
MMIDQIREDLKKNLTDKRFNHSMRVIETAKELAQIHGEDLRKTTLAALCHDYAKYIDHNQYGEIAISSGEELDDCMECDLGLAHGMIGAILIKQRYNISNEDILNAVRYHTYGRASMSRLEKIIYLADYIEPGRDFKGIEKLRQMARLDLDQCMILALRSSIEYVKSQNRHVHPRSVEALEYYNNGEVSV